MRKTIVLILCFFALAASAQRVQVLSDRVVVSSGGYFPQLSDDGKKLIYAPTDAVELKIMDLDTKQVSTISNKDLPGFEAKFGPDGKVYYVTMARQPNHLVYRTGRRYDPETGENEVLLEGQHGQVLAVRGSEGMAITGEHESYNIRNAGTFAITRGATIYVFRDGRKAKELTPVKDVVGLLWASVSPDGRRIVFEAVSKGVMVCDMEGRIVAKLGRYLMPCWLNDDYIIAMCNSKYNKYNIYLLRSDGSSSRSLTPNVSGPIQPMVSGHKVCYTTKKGAVHIMELEVKTAEELKAEAEAAKAEAERKAAEAERQRLLQQQKQQQDDDDDDTDDVDHQ